MNRFVSLAAVVAALALALPVTAFGASISKATQFRSGNVTCGVEIHSPAKPASDVLCSAPGIPAPKQSAAFGDPGFVALSVLGQPQLLRLSQDSFVSGTSVVLGRGRLWNQLGVTCHVAATTVICFNGANHGFVIGNGQYRSF